MRIGVVNDTAMAVEVLTRLVDASGDHQVAWVARDGAEAVARCAEALPDLVLMDLYMPVMDGVQATRRIMTTTPCPILIVTATVEGHAAKVFEALAAGALDVVATPALGKDGTVAGASSFLAKIAMIQMLVGGGTRTPQGRVVTVPGTKARVVTTARVPSRPPGASPGPLVAIGASAGGPGALAILLHELPRTFSGAIVIVQHVDEQFAAGMARWLGEQADIPVRVAEPGEAPVRGTALVAGTGEHLVLTEDGTFRYTPEPRQSSYRPSVDVFFNSVVAHWSGGVVGVVLTGMGRDGSRGLLALKESGAVTIAQDRATSAVYGMPRAATESGAAVEVLPLARIAPRLTELTERGVPKLHPRVAP